jgi:hypothetical protein
MSVPASTFPVPEVLDWMTPFCAVITCREVRDVLEGVPSSAMASRTTPTAASPRRYRCQGTVRLLLVADIATTIAEQAESPARRG